MLYINFIKPINFLYEFDSIKKVFNTSSIPVTDITSYMKPTFTLHSRQDNYLGSTFFMPCLKLLGNVDCLKCSETNAQISSLKVEIDSTSKLSGL